MRYTKNILKWFLYLLIIPVGYITISLILSAIPMGQKQNGVRLDKSIYLSSNGIHLDLIIPRENIDSTVLHDLSTKDKETFLAFGWEDENYFNGNSKSRDLEFNNVFKAMFLKTKSLIHVTRLQQKENHWVEVKVSKNQLKKLNKYLSNTFATDKYGRKLVAKSKGYSSSDNFYKTTGFYSCLNTCNTWVNEAFKQSGLMSCVWTPFDFGVLNRYM